MLTDEGNVTSAVEEERAPSSEVVKESSEPVSGPTSEYSASARRRHLAKTTDLIPKRWITVTMVVLGLCTGVGLINVLYLFSAELVAVMGPRAEEVFSLSARGSLSQWFTTILLIISGMASLQIYALRQHRSNDYRGTYKLWFWLAFLLLFASLDSAVGLRDLALSTVNYVTGLAFSHGGWPLIFVKLFVLSVLVGRGLVEVRKSSTAIVGVVIVWLAYAGATLIQLPQLQDQTGAQHELFYGNMTLVGSAVLILTIFLYARFVYLSAQGLIAVPQATAQIETAKSAPKRSKRKASASKKNAEVTGESGRSTTETSKKASRSKRVAAATENADSSSEKASNTKPKSNSKTRSKSKSTRKSVQPDPPVERVADSVAPEPQESRESEQEEATIASLPLGGKLSKAQRRRQRKQEKQERQQQRRAA